MKRNFSRKKVNKGRINSEKSVEEVSEMVNRIMANELYSLPDCKSDVVFIVGPPGSSRF